MGAGVCFYVRSNFNYTVREDLQSDRLECLTHSRPFLVSTWYRPPNSHADLFNEFENFIGKIDSLNLELYLVNDMNVNMPPGTADPNSAKLRNTFDIYSLNQLIAEPTRVTVQSQYLLYLCLTNTPDKVRSSGVLPSGISDHSLVCLVRKAHYSNRGRVRTITTRSFNYFDKDEFLLHVGKKGMKYH